LEKLGVEFKHMDLKKGEWIELEDRNRRKNRKKQVDEIDLKAKSLVKKPKKVKPGYKKKMQQQVETIKKREKRINSRKK